MFAVLAALGCMTACTAEQAAPSASATNAPAHVLRTLPAADKDAFSKFFSRWSAYTLALGTGADELGEVYTGLSRMADSWSNTAYCTSPTGPSYVTLSFPESDGKLMLEAADGKLTAGTVEWNSEQDDEVSATLTTMVACNALVYGLCASSDPTAAQYVYTQCVENMERNADGMLMGGPETLAGYAFVLELNPETQQMVFSGTPEESASGG